MEVEFKDGKFLEGDELEFLRYIVNQVGASIHIVEIDTQLGSLPIWMNERYQDVIGYSYQDRLKIGLSYQHGVIYHSDDYEIIREGISELIRNPESCKTAPFRIKTAGGKWKWISNTAKRITLNQNDNYLLCVVVDLDPMLLEFPKLVDRYSQEILDLKKQLLIRDFSKIEIEIIELLCKGMTVKEIATLRYRSPETINNHKRNIFKKAKVNKISELVAFAIGHGLGH